MNYAMIKGDINTYKMTLQDLYNMLDNRYKIIKMSSMVRVLNDNLMPESIVDELLHQRIYKEKVLRK